MKNTGNYIKSSLTWAVAVSLVVMPVAAFADSGGNDDNNRRKQSSGCSLRAFGHLIAPGWIKKNGTSTSSDDDDCSLPPGIAKKISSINNRGPGNANDTTAPIIRNVTINPGINRAVVTWTTNENSDSKVFYSLTSPVNASSSNTLSVSSSLRVTNHRLVLRNLSPNTTYLLTVSSKDRFGNTATGTEVSFTTQPASTTGTDTVAPTVSLIVVTPGATTATVTWNTDEAADSAVFFSTSLPVNTSATATQAVSSDIRITTHSLQMTGLSTSTTYYAVVRSRDASGNVTLSSPVSFTTGANADVTAPTITNLVTVVGTSTLKFMWNTNELATSKVFYSTTTPVNVTSTSTPFVEDTALVTSHSVTLTGLSTSTLYRVIVQSKDSSLNVGNVIEFPVTTSQ